MKKLEKYWNYIVIVFIIFMFLKPIICFLILGSIILYVCLDYLRVYKVLNRHGISKTGIIIKYTRGWKGYQTPTINFSITSGEIIEEEPYFYSSSDVNKFRTFKNYIEKPVEIKYNPENPKEFLISAQANSNIIGIYIFVFVALFFTIAGILDICGIININF